MSAHAHCPKRRKTSATSPTPTHSSSSSPASPPPPRTTLSRSLPAQALKTTPQQLPTPPPEATPQPPQTPPDSVSPTRHSTPVPHTRTPLPDREYSAHGPSGEPDTDPFPFDALPSPPPENSKDLNFIRSHATGMTSRTAAAAAAAAARETGELRREMEEAIALLGRPWGKETIAISNGMMVVDSESDDETEVYNSDGADDADADIDTEEKARREMPPPPMSRGRARHRARSRERGGDLKRARRERRREMRDAAPGGLAHPRECFCGEPWAEGEWDVEYCRMYSWCDGVMESSERVEGGCR